MEKNNTRHDTSSLRREEMTMTLKTKDGQPVHMTARMQVVDLLLSSRDLVGPRRWGMIQLYYRAGLTQQEIADIFGTSRQAVTTQMRHAVKLVLWAVLTRHPKAPPLETELTESQRQEVLSFLGKDFNPEGNGGAPDA